MSSVIESARFDEDGFLTGPLRLLDEPAPTDAFLVFAQRTDARLEAHFWQKQAARFFDTELSLVVDKAYDRRETMPARDAAILRLSSGVHAVSATVFCGTRPTCPADLERAHVIEERTGTGGLFGLAQRCRYVWLVDATQERPALLLSAIIASLVLGPILTPQADELIGVKTARQRLERSIATAAPSSG